MDQQSKPPEILYHYTTQEGMLGITQTRQIWATNLLFLNDSMELNYAIQKTKNRIEHIKTNLPQKDVQFVSDFSDRLDEIDYPSTQSFEGIYVCSFSKNGNQLSQWRSYCVPGSGFSIGFDFNSPLKNIINSQRFRLVKCIYDEGEQFYIIEKFIDEILEIFHKSNNAYSATTESWEKFLTLAPALKHPKFEEEQEWRLVSEPRWLYGVRFRKGKSMLIPYVPINIANTPDEDRKNKITWLPEIWIGPTPYPQLSFISLEHLLRTTGFWKMLEKDGSPLKGCEILYSDIPYRVW